MLTTIEFIVYDVSVLIFPSLRMPGTQKSRMHAGFLDVSTLKSGKMNTILAREDLSIMTRANKVNKTFPPPFFRSKAGKLGKQGFEPGPLWL